MKYASVGVVNTLIHWLSFYAALASGLTQSVSNLIAFCIAVTFSFFVNARWTFSSEYSLYRYIMYVIFLGSLAWITGAVADNIQANPVVTLITFSAISLVAGFLYSKFIVFRDAK